MRKTILKVKPAILQTKTPLPLSLQVIAHLGFRVQTTLILPPSMQIHFHSGIPDIKSHKNKLKTCLCCT